MADRIHTLLFQTTAPGPGAVVYFAHSKRDYHTPAAQAALDVIRAQRPRARVLDPSGLDAAWPELVRRLGSNEAVYARIIASVAEVVALEHQGHIGRGVYCELYEAGRRSIPRWAVRGGQLRPVHALRLVDPTDYKVRFGRLILGGR